MPQTFTYPWYTHCTNYQTWAPLSPTLLAVLGALSGGGLLLAPFMGGFGGIIGVTVGAICGYSAIATVFNWLLGGKLVCLGGGIDQIVCGTVTALEPPQDSILDPGNIDNDYSWNMLLCPYKIVERTDSNGNVLYDSNGNTIFDPQPYGPPGYGMYDPLCLQTPEFTYLYNKYPQTIVAPNPYAQIGPMTGTELNNAFSYFEISSINGGGPLSPETLPAGWALPNGFPPPDITAGFPVAAGDVPVGLFGQGDSPSGAVCDVFPMDDVQNPDYNFQTKGLSAQMHCEIEGSRIYNMQTAANVMMSVLTVAAAVATALATAGPFGWLLALLVLFLALVADAIIAGLTWALGSDPNVGGGQDTSPNLDGYEGVENELTLNVGDFIVVLGRWVFDAGHSPNAGSNELHPVKQVYVPTAIPETVEFCSLFCAQYTEVIKSSSSPGTIANQSSGIASFAFHPDVDGCEPANNPSGGTIP